MPITDFSNLAIQLKAIKQKLATATYAAVFAYSSEARANAAVEASVLDKELRDLLNGANTAAHQVATFMNRSHADNPLAAATELIQLLQTVAYAEPRDEAPQQASVDLRAMEPCAGNCASVRAAAVIN